MLEKLLYTSANESEVSESDASRTNYKEKSSKAKNGYACGGLLEEQLLPFGGAGIIRNKSSKPSNNTSARQPLTHQKVRILATKTSTQAT